MIKLGKFIPCYDSFSNEFKVLKEDILERVKNKSKFTKKFDKKHQDIYYIGEIGEECIYELLVKIRNDSGRYHNPYISVYNIYRHQLYFDEYEQDGLFSISDLTAHPYLIQIKTTCFSSKSLRYLPIERNLNSDIYSLVYYDKYNEKVYAIGWISRHEVLENLNNFKINEYNKITIPEIYLHKDFSEIIKRNSSIPEWQCNRSKAHYILGIIIIATEFQYNSNGDYKRIFKEMRSYGDRYDFIIFTIRNFFKLVNYIHYRLFKKGIKDKKIIDFDFSMSFILEIIKEYCIKNNNGIYEGEQLRVNGSFCSKKIKDWVLKNKKS